MKWATPEVSLWRSGAAELFLGDFLMGHGLDDVGPGDEHVGGLVHHQDKVGNGGRIDRAAGAGAHDGGDLRNHAGGQRVAQEDIGIAGQREHAFLNAGAAGVVEPDQRRADAHGHVHDLDDFGGVGFRQRTAEDGEVLGENKDQATLDAAIAGDEAVAEILAVGHAEISATVGHQLVGLFKAVLVEQELNPLARRHLAFLVLPFAALGAAAVGRQLITPPQFFELLFQIHAAMSVAGKGRGPMILDRGNRGSGGPAGSYTCRAHPPHTDAGD